MESRLSRLLMTAALFGAIPTTTFAKNASEFAKTLTSQKAGFEDRIAGLQREVDDLFAEKSYCSAQERTEAYNKIRELQRQITALRNEYNLFKAGSIKTAATPGYGPQLDAAGIHPDDRKYWADDDNALAKLRESALAKANRIEQAPYRDCSEPKSTSPPQPPVTPKAPKTAPQPPGVTSQPPAASGGQKPSSGCTDNEAAARRLRIQDEILRLEEELIPIDGTTKEGRARQLQLRAEIDRLAGLLSLPCPPLLPPLKPAIPAPKPVPVPAPPLKVEPKAGASHSSVSKTPAAELAGLYGGLAGIGLGLAYGGKCDAKRWREIVAELDEMAARAEQIADAAQAGGAYSSIAPDKARKEADEIRRTVDAWKAHPPEGCGDGSTGRLDPFAREILVAHNTLRAEYGVGSLVWDDVLAQHARDYAQELARVGQLTHASREGRGIERENISQGLTGWTVGQHMGSWLKEKSKFKPGVFPDVSTTGTWYDVGHLTQMIWPETFRIGCGAAKGGVSSWMVCRYSPGGNKDGKPVGLPLAAQACTRQPGNQRSPGKATSSDDSSIKIGLHYEFGGSVCVPYQETKVPQPELPQKETFKTPEPKPGDLDPL